VTFDSPTHTPCEIPATGSGPTPRATVSSVPFGAPRVARELGPLSYQPLQFDSYDFDQDLIQLDLSDLAAFNTYEMSCQLMVIMSGGGIFTVHFDTPSIRNINFNPNGKVSILVPGQGEMSIGTFEFGQIVQLRVRMDLVSNTWEIYLDNVLAHSGSIGITFGLSSVRFSTRTIAGPLLGGLDDVVIRGLSPVAVGDDGRASARTRFWTSPNPFEGSADFRFDLALSGAVNVEVFDVEGRQVATLSRIAAKGPGRLVWDGRGPDGRPVPAGTYLYRASGGGAETRGRVVKLR
jgi:hypothetical protein